MKKGILISFVSSLLILMLLTGLYGCSLAKKVDIKVSETKVNIGIDDSKTIKIRNYDELVGVVIEVENEDIADVTDDNGEITVTGLQAGKTKIYITALNSNEEAVIKVTVTEAAAVVLSNGNYYYEGRIGSTMKTAWFDFIITNAYCTEDAIGGYAPSDGNELVVVEITITNTFSETVPMNNYDFQLQWGDNGNAYSWPVEASNIIDNQFPEEYKLKVGSTITGVYVYEAPGGETDLNISFVEYYEDNTEGDQFWVYFTADEK